MTSSSAIITNETRGADDPFAPIHPGEILKEEYMEELGLTAYGLAKRLCVPRDRIESIVRGQRAITADTSIRLGRLFGQSPQFWLNLQMHYDLERARDALGERVEEIDPIPTHAA